MAHDLFLAFPREARSHVSKLHTQLVRFGVDAFYDAADAHEHWGPSIHQALLDAPAIAIFVPHEFTASSYFQAEIQHALERRDQSKVPLIVLAEDRDAARKHTSLYGLSSYQMEAWQPDDTRGTALRLSRSCRTAPLSAQGRRFSRTIADGVQITITVGDLFSQETDIGVLSSDCFDTDVATAIAQSSLKAILVQRWFQGDRAPLDHGIEMDLQNQSATGTDDDAKTFGKKRRYPFGTTAAVIVDNRRAFLSVGAQIAADTSTFATPESLWLSLCGLWRRKHRADVQSPISVSLWGSAFGRSNLTKAQAGNLVIQSFGVMIRTMRVTPELRLVIWTPDYCEELMERLVGALETLPVDR